MSRETNTEHNQTNTIAQTKVVGLRSLPRQQVVITLASVLLAMFLSSLDHNIVGTAMPKIIADLGGFSHYTWVTTAYIIASTIALPITGKLTDMYGRKWFYIGGLIIFILGSLLSGMSRTMTQIILARGFQGIGAGVMMCNAFTVIADLFPPAERGKYQGLMSSVMGISSVIGPTLGGYITDAFSWHWIFFINIPLGILVILLFIFSFPDYRPNHTQPSIDYWGTTLLVLMITPAMLALSWGGTDFPWLSAPIIGMFLFSAVMAYLFLLVERKAKEPVIPLRLFENRIVTASALVIFFSGITMFAGITFVPLFFQGVLGLSATTSGSFLTPMTLGMVVGSFISGQALSRTGGHYRLHGAIGLGIMALGTALISRMNVDTSYVIALIAIIMMGIGLGITMPIYAIAIQNAVPYNIIGSATSIVPFFRSIGGAIGLATVGSVMSNRFAAIFLSSLPPTVKTVIPPETLNSLAYNPQALVSIPAQNQLQTLFIPLGQPGTLLFDQLLQNLRQALSSSLTEVFLVGLAMVIIAFIINLFIKEIPLRKQHVLDEDK